ASSAGADCADRHTGRRERVRVQRDHRSPARARRDAGKYRRAEGERGRRGPAGRQARPDDPRPERGLEKDDLRAGDRAGNRRSRSRRLSMRRWIVALLVFAVGAFSIGRADSLWERRDPRYAFLFKDNRARSVGDTLTIIISEATVANDQDQ